jgi:hypothetical protein
MPAGWVGSAGSAKIGWVTGQSAAIVAGVAAWLANDSSNLTGTTMQATTARQTHLAIPFTSCA